MAHLGAGGKKNSWERQVVRGRRVKECEWTADKRDGTRRRAAGREKGREEDRLGNRVENSQARPRREVFWAGQRRRGRDDERTYATNWSCRKKMEE